MSKYTTFEQLTMLAQRSKTEIGKVDTKVTTLEERADKPLRTASCGELMRAAKAAGQWVVRDFQPGDVVIYDFSGKQKTTEHCGIVELELPDYVDSATATSSGRAEFNRAQALDAPVARSVQAIEGNTSQSGSQSNGGMVCRKSRPGKYIVGAVRPRFDEETSGLLTAGVINGGSPEGLLKRDEFAAVMGRRGLL